MKRAGILIFFACMMLFTIKLEAQNMESFGLKTLSGQFEKVYIENNFLADTVRGAFYYDAPSKVFLDVTYPLHQIMLAENNVLFIYYPKTRQAFRFEGLNPIALPLVSGLIATIRPDYGMKEFGLQLLDQEVLSDSLIFYWSHPLYREQLGDYKIVEVDERLFYTLYESPDKQQFSKISFENYISQAGFNFPMIIRSELRTGHSNATEYVALDSLKVNKDLPAYISQFRIPEDIDIVERKW